MNQDENTFESFDAAHPEVWRLFQNFTMDRIRRGFEHYSSDAILHRIRWETDATTEDGDGFKINNNWTPFYARKFHNAYSEHNRFFRTRKSKFDAVGT